MNCMTRLGTVVLMVVCVSSHAAMTLSDLTPGKTVSGPDLSLKEMKGKVVLVDYWGTR